MPREAMFVKLEGAASQKATKCSVESSQPPP